MEQDPISNKHKLTRYRVTEKEDCTSDISVARCNNLSIAFKNYKHCGSGAYFNTLFPNLLTVL